VDQGGVGGEQDLTDLNAVYRQRFPSEASTRRADLWREIAAYLQRYIPVDSVVLDIAADQGLFITHITARERWATDLRDTSSALPASIRFVQADGLSLDRVLPNEHFDRIFMSNYLEHLPSHEAVIQQLRVAAQLLKPGGQVIILQPNIRLTGPAYWDFIDHKVAITDRSLAEAVEIVGLQVRKVIPRFLPYTTKSRLPQSARLVRAYLAFPLAWRILGKQTLLIAERRA
jgi:SAM-dependent methyltransferase